MIAMKTAGKLVRRVLLPPEVIALAAYWLIPLALLVGYFIQLPDAMAAGITPMEFSSVFLTRVSIWLSPVTVPLLGISMIYLYIHAVCTTVPYSAAHRKARARSAFYSVASLLHDASLYIRTWWCGPDAGWTLPAANLTTSPLRLATQRGLPSHLSAGWSPGTHPQVVYG